MSISEKGTFGFITVVLINNSLLSYLIPSANRVLFRMVVDASFRICYEMFDLYCFADRRKIAIFATLF